MKTHKRLYNIAKQSHLEADWKACRTMRNLVHSKLKEAHNNYICRLIDDSFNAIVNNFGNTSEQNVKIIMESPP